MIRSHHERDEATILSRRRSVSNLAGRPERHPFPDHPMSLFLCLSERYRLGLETLDPLREEWLMKVLDPWSSQREKAELHWGRILGFFLLLSGPLWLLSAIHSPTLGGKLTGPGGIVSDMGLYGITVFIGFSLVMIPISRRVFGVMLHELILREVLLMTWGLYLILGTLLFFLPLLPLRNRMATAKQKHLMKLLGSNNTAEEQTLHLLGENRLDAQSLVKLLALDKMVEKAMGMAIWPFDRETLVRYFELLLSPLLPFVAEKCPEIVKHYLEHGL